MDEAIEFLKIELQDGAIPASKLLASAREVGISEATLRRAKKRLNLYSFKMPGHNKFYTDFKTRSHFHDAAQDAHGSSSMKNERDERHVDLNEQFPFEATM